MIEILARQALAAVALVLLVGCTASPPKPPPPSPPIAGLDATACDEAGGAVRPVCRRQRPMCVIPYKDAGKACTDDAQCAGGCVYDGAPLGVDGATTGVCRKDNDPCGCVEHVMDGKKSGGVCID